jgi:hypothetical protein
MPNIKCRRRAEVASIKINGIIKYDVVYCDINVQTLFFLLHCYFILLYLPFDPENGSRIFLRNIDELL